MQFKIWVSLNSNYGIEELVFSATFGSVEPSFLKAQHIEDFTMKIKALCTFID